MRQCLITQPQFDAQLRQRIEILPVIALASGGKSGFLTSTMETDPTNACNQDDATDFIRLNVLRLKVAAKVQRKK